VDMERISGTLQKVRRGEEVPIVTLKRTLNLEGWLRDLRALGVMDLETFKPKPQWHTSIPVRRTQG
jgi:hypothetical protein